MDKVKKALNKLSFREKQKLKKILIQINAGDFQNLDLRKLKGKSNIFRVRIGNIRIIFHKIDSSIKILTIECRGSKTYRKR